MPWSSGTFSRTNGTNTGSQLWAADRDAGTKIRADRHDTHDQDVADGVNNTLTKDGQNSPLGNLPMATFKHTNVGLATARTDYARADQVQDSTLSFVTDGGAANAYTANLNPAITTYTQGMVIRIKITNTNTGASTANFNSIGAKSILLMDGSDPAAGNLVAGRVYVLIYESVLDSLFLVNPSFEINPLPLNAPIGMITSNGTDATNDIDITAGQWRSADNTQNLVLAADAGKQLDATWVSGGTPGAPMGGRSSTQTLADGTWHVIAGLVSGVTEIGFDTSVTGANLVTDHSFSNTRRIASIIRDTGAIVPYRQDGDRFLRDVPIRDDDQNNPGVLARTITLSVPTGEVFFPVVSTWVQHITAGSNYGLLSALTQTDTAPSASVFNYYGRGQGSAARESVTVMDHIPTNTSAQVRTRLSVSDGNTTQRLVTHGWIDSRGRDG